MRTPHSRKLLTSRRGPCRRSRAGGFSLPELLVVVFLVGVAAMTLMPNLKVLARKNRVNDGARQVQAALQLARMKSINEGNDQVVQFTSNGWNIFVDTNRNGTRDTSEKWLYTTPIRLPIGVTYQLPASEPSDQVLSQSATEGCKCIRWQSNGTMRLTSTATMYGASIGNGKDYRRLSISAAGSIKYQIWNGSRWD